MVGKNTGLVLPLSRAILDATSLQYEAVHANPYML